MSRRKKRDAGSRTASHSGAAPASGRPHRDTGPTFPISARAATWITLGIVAGVTLFAHALFLMHAGPTWRDEANTVAFARMPSLAAINAALQYDSVPLASTLLVRAWMAMTGGSDSALRALGLIVGLLTLAALALNTRRRGALLPIATLLVFALNVWVIRGGDAIRPMGLGMLFIVLTFTAVAAMLERPGPRWGAIAALCAVLAVQSIYSNAPLVGGICIAGMVVGLVTRSRARAAWSAGVGAVAALSLLPYVPAIRASNDWGALVRFRADLGQLVLALAGTSSWDIGLWVLLAAIAATVVVVMMVRNRAKASVGRDADLFAGVALLAGAVAVCTFFAVSGLVTQPWYYLPLLALAAASLDSILAPRIVRPAAIMLACVVVLLVTLAHAIETFPAMRLRQTNLDRIAATLADSAKANDFVVVTPWYNGVSFDRFYRGRAKWTTIPPITDHRIHRYDLIKQRMQEPGAMDPTLAAMESTLRSGARVWVVGSLPVVAEGDTALPPPRAPDPNLGWNVGNYIALWGRQAFVLLLRHGVRADVISVATPAAVWPYENEQLYVVQGWK